MNGPTHVVGGALAGLTVAAVSGTGIEASAAITAAAVATSKLPDLDRYIDKSPQHRSLPHSLILGGGGVLVAALIALGVLASGTASEQIYSMFSGHIVTPITLHFAVIGAVSGYFAHLGLDAMTTSGIWLLWPKGKRIGLPTKKAVKSGGTRERAIAGLMIVCCIGLGLLVFGGEVDAPLALAAVGRAHPAGG